MSNEIKTGEIVAELENVEAIIASARERAKALQAQADELEKAIKVARGTGDVAKQAAAAVQLARPPLPKRVENMLRDRPVTLEEVIKASGEAAGKVQAVMKEFREAGSIHNVGTSDRPRWFWRIGPNATSKETQAAVLTLITDQPMTFAELKAATGGRDSQVQGALIEIRRTPNTKVLNLGAANRIRYFVVGPNAVDASLSPKAAKK